MQRVEIIRALLTNPRLLILLLFAGYAAYYWFSNRSTDPYTGETVTIDKNISPEDEKALGLHVDRVFWRFPLPTGTSSAQDAADTESVRNEDEYVVQGVRQAITNPNYHVAEDSWDQFEKARQVEPLAANVPGDREQ